MTRLLSAVLTIGLAGPIMAQDQSLADSATWDDLRYDLIGDAPVADGTALFEVEAPYRANDAATVPIHVVQIDPGQRIRAAMVVVDENPAPVAAEFTFAEDMAPLDMELRVRVNQYSNVRVLAETEAGLSMNGRFVKASGGCSAPATRDPEAALADMGAMKLRQFLAPAAGQTADGGRREAQIMIRHPNYSGLQRDQITQLFVPAHFIDSLEVRQGNDLLWTMQGGISISENPVFRFDYTDNGAAAFHVRATDTDGNVFERTLSKEAAS